jgi:hypothetical protein
MSHTNMAEPQPSNIQEGASDAPAPTGSAEDRKAAAALSSLDERDDADSGKKNVDTTALGEAMKNLDVSEKKDTKEAVNKKVVKVDAADVSLLVSVRLAEVVVARGLLRDIWGRMEKYPG